MEAATPHVTVQSIRSKFESQAANTKSPFDSQNRVSIKRSPAFRNNGERVQQTHANANEEPASSKKPSLKRKPCVDRSSKPTTLSPAGKEPSQADPRLLEALKAPLPSGPAPKKPPRTFVHDIYMETKGLKEKNEVPQRPARKKSSRTRESNPTTHNTPPGRASTLVRAKTDPSIRRRSSDPKDYADSRIKSEKNKIKKEDQRSTEDERKASVGSWDETLTQCRWSNPVQWNSFSPPRKSKSASAFKGSSNTLKSRISTSLMALAPDQIAPEQQRRTRGNQVKSVPAAGKNFNKNVFRQTLMNFEVMAERPGKKLTFEVAEVGKSSNRGSNRKDLERVYDEPYEDPGLHYMSSPVMNLVSSDSQDQEDQSTENSDSESDINVGQMQAVEDRKIYIRRVSSRVCDVQRSRALSLPDEKSLFDAFLVVALYYDRQSHCYHPYIKSRFPSYVNVPEGLEQFCFPDSADWSTANCTVDPYTVVLTDSEGRRQYGYCRRIVPEGSHAPIPITYCILSRHKAAGFYNKVLRELTTRHGISESHLMKLLEALKFLRFPEPGQNVIFPDPLSGKDIKISRPIDARLEDPDLSVLFSRLDHNTISCILGTLLLERKLLFLGTNLSVMSSCIQAVQLMLYPFTWQHTLVPVLPKSMTELCSAPTPYVMGIFTSEIEEFQTFNPDQGMVVDLNNGKVLHSVGDESSLLPKRAARALESSWQLTDVLTQESDSARNALLSESFVRFFVEVCGHYPEHIKTRDNGRRVFERTAFVEGHSSHSVRLFLDWFTETAMFNIFIESRLNEVSTPGLFEHKILERSIQLSSSPQLILRNSKLLSRKIKTIGDKLREMNVFS